MNTQIESESRLPTMWQKCIGVVSILLMLPMISVVASTGSALSKFSLQLKEPPILALTPVLIKFGRLLGDFRYIVMGLTIGIYALCIVKNARRLLWFNAVASVLLPLTLWFTFSIAMEQEEVLFKWLRQQQAAGADIYR